MEVKILGKLLCEMTNISIRDTMLPYELWVDENGNNNTYRHHRPRVKIKVENEFIPVSISKTPEILVNKNIPKFSIVKKFISEHSDELLAHWYLEITTYELIRFLVLQIRKKMTKREALIRMLHEDDLEKVPERLKFIMKEVSTK